MGKLSKLLLNTIVCMSVNGQDDPKFQVTSCNAEVSIKSWLNFRTNFILKFVNQEIRHIFWGRPMLRNPQCG